MVLEAQLLRKKVLRKHFSVHVHCFCSLFSHVLYCFAACDFLCVKECKLHSCTSDGNSG